jgi:hypothetical protein
MDEFLKLNQGVIEPYLERMYENFEVTSYDFKNGTPSIILYGNGYAHCLDPLVKDKYKCLQYLHSLIVHDIGISKEYEEYGNDNSFFIYEISAEIGGIIISSLIDRFGKIHYWNPDWKSINPHVIKSLFIRGD